MKPGLTSEKLRHGRRATKAFATRILAWTPNRSYSPHKNVQQNKSQPSLVVSRVERAPRVSAQGAECQMERRWRVLL